MWLPGQNWTVAVQSSTPKQEHMTRGKRGCAEIQMQGCELKCMQINRFILRHASSDNQVFDFTHHRVTNGSVHVSRKCSWSLRQPSISSWPRHSAANSPAEVTPWPWHKHYNFFTTLLYSPIFSSVFSLSFVCPISLYPLSLSPFILTFLLPSWTIAPLFTVHRSPSVAAWGTAPADLP